MDGIPPTTTFVANLFEAMITDEGWSATATLIAAEMGVDQAAIVVNRSSATPDVSVTSDILDIIAVYDARYQALDPWAARRKILPPNRIMLANEILSENLLVRTEFYNDYARPIGMLRPMTADIISAGGHYIEVGAEQPFATRRFEPEDKARLGGMLPFVARAVDLRQRLKAAKLRETLAGVSLVDAWAIPSLVCTRAAEVVTANQAAEQLASRGVLGWRDGGLGLAAANAMLTPQVRRMIAAAADGGAGGALHVADHHADGRYMILVSPVPPSMDRGPGFALVTISHSAGRHFDRPALIAMFGLSPAQADLALGLYDGLSLEAYAAKRGVKISTLKTQLMQLFSRLGVKSQKDLVAAIGRLPPVNI